MKRFSTLVMSLALLIGCGLPEQSELAELQPAAIVQSNLNQSGVVSTSSTTSSVAANSQALETAQPIAKQPDESSVHCSWWCYGNCREEGHSHTYCSSRCCW